MVPKEKEKKQRKTQIKRRRRRQVDGERRKERHNEDHKIEEGKLCVYISVIFKNRSR
jgi:hypothetical protein